jgi:hypothetical protein
MKSLFTFLLIFFTVFTLNAQLELIRNGDFSQGVTGSHNLKDIAFWNMDIADPTSEWWDRATLASSDPPLYQVVELITNDSTLYTCTFNANNTWISDRVVVTASVTGYDSSIRTAISSKTIHFDEPFEFKFGFSENSVYAGKKLVIEFDIMPHDTSIAKGDTSWCEIDDVSMKKIIAGVNSAPVAIVGSPQTAKGGDLVTLDGSGSYDFEGSPLTYTWVSVYPGIVFNDKHAVSPTFTAPDVTELTKFEFTLKVNDGELNSEIVITTVTVSPAGELIRNGGFELFLEGSDPSSESLKDIAYWNIDLDEASIQGGRWGNTGLKQATLASIDPTLYQVIKTIGAKEATYSLSFSARSSWNSVAVKSIFSIAEVDSTIRTEIDSKEATLDIDVPGGISTTVSKVFTHIFVIPANSAYVGKKLVLEFDNIPYDDGTDNGWAEIDNISLIESVSSSVPLKAQVNLTIYPNPASERIYIQSTAKITKVEIFSVLGSLEKTYTNSDIRQVELGDLSKGLYFMCLTSKTGTITKKIQVK